MVVHHARKPSEPTGKNSNSMRVMEEGISSPATTAVPGSASSTEPKKGWIKWGKETVQEEYTKHYATEFNGKRGFNGRFFRRPAQRPEDIVDAVADLERDEKHPGKYIYRNQFGQKAPKYDDVAAYLSPTNYVPKRLLVQATPYVRDKHAREGDWRRNEIKGSVPRVLKIAEWALRPSDPNSKGKTTPWGYLHSSIRIFFVGLPLQILLSFPTTESWDNDVAIEDNYKEHAGYYWKWPKYAINPLDQRPDTLVVKKSTFARYRILRPRQLIVLKDGQWVLDTNPDKTLSYIFISYANVHFNTDKSEQGKALIKKMAEVSALAAGVTAYWLDFVCRAENDGDLLDSDVYRMCDVIKGATRVVVMLKSDHLKLKQEWGARMWTLPEALLCQGEHIYFCYPDDEESFKIISMNKVEMTGSVWSDSDTSEGEGGSTRLLAEHFTGVISLSRLEILSTAIDALSQRGHVNYKFFAKADIAYALMGLLHYRIEKADEDTLFQAIARLSLANDSDRLIERMVCLYPDPHEISDRTLFEKLAKVDEFSTHLWDIEPLCQMVGVADEDNTVILDNCRAMHIRWKNFPQMVVKRHVGFKKLMAELFVRSGAWWFMMGINLLITYSPFLIYTPDNSSTNSTGDTTDDALFTALAALLGGFFAVGMILSFAGPFSVRRLYGGQVLQSTANLIAFEGVLPRSQLEALVFGNDRERLSYEPSSTPFCRSFRDPKERIGLEPDWIASGNPSDIADVEKQLPPGQRLFTLVDTGSLSISIFSAERPPTVALICGREGGMLRTVLCSWRFKNDCLYKETVIRMPSDVYESATAKSWLKLCLGA